MKIRILIGAMLCMSACDEPSGTEYMLNDGTTINCLSTTIVDCGLILDYCDDHKRHYCEDAWETE